MSLLFGIVPEAIYFTFYLCKMKNLKNKKLLLFVAIGVLIILATMLSNYNLYLYLLLILGIYAVIKLLYKRKVQIIDIFVIDCLYAYLMIVSFVSFYVFKNNVEMYWYAYVLDRILLFIPTVVAKKLKMLYNLYCKLWNRNERNKLRSISVRNTSLILMNVFIFIINAFLIYINQK